MKKLVSIIFVFTLMLTNGFPQEQCPGGVGRILSNGIHKWYWNGDLSFLRIKKEVNGSFLDPTTAATVFRNAINTAAAVWSQATQGAVSYIEGTASDHDLEVSCQPNGSDTDGRGSGTGGLFVYTDYIWTDNTSLVGPNSQIGDIYTICIHEMGHIFGAMHSNSFSVMNYVYNQVKRSLTNCDASYLVSVYNPADTVTVKNNFAGGKIKVDYVTYDNVPLEGVPTFSWRETTFPHDLYAFDNQTTAPDGYKRLWKYWTKPAETDANLHTTIASPQNGTFEADFDKEYHIIFQNNFGSSGRNDGQIQVGVSIVSSPSGIYNNRQGQSISATALTQTIDDIDLTLDHWSEGTTNLGSTNPMQVTPNDHKNYKANLKGKPFFTNRYLRLSTTVGAPDTLYWQEHQSADVTQYRIYRMVRPAGGTTGPEQLIATVNRGTTTYVDYDYVISNMFYYQVYYDVRAYYSPSGTTSDPNFVSTFSQIAPSIADGKNLFVSSFQDKPTEYSISNYPNPFNPTTTINYQLPENGFVTIKVFDVLGKEIAVLVNENKSTGYYNVSFDASKLTSGVYIYTINVSSPSSSSGHGFTQSKKMLLVK